MSTDPAPPSDLSAYRRVPDLPALAALPGSSRASRTAWPRARRLAALAITPIALWVWADATRGQAWTSLPWFAVALTAALGTTSTLSAYVGRGSASGVSCGLAPLVLLAGAGVLLFRDAAPLSAALALVLVAVATSWGSRARC